MADLAGLFTAIRRTAGGTPASRVTWRADDRVHIAVRGIRHERGTELARAVEDTLGRHQAVRWAAVNAPLGVVVVACDSDVRVPELIAQVECLENQYSAQPERPADKPPSMDRVPGIVTSMAVTAAGLAFAGVGRAMRTIRLPPELGSLVNVIDTQPRLRAAVEQAIGRDGADFAISAANTLAQSAAQGLTGLALDIGYRAALLAESMSQRDSWARSEPQLCGESQNAAAQPVTPERPRPIPAGPVERYSEKIGLGSAAAFGGALAVSGSSRRAAAVALAGLPKAARLGREGFATMLGCLLARRGVVVVDHRQLRLLDRIDTIVLDTDVLPAGTMTVGEVVPVTDGDAAHLAGVVHALFVPERAAETATDGAFTLGPLDALGLKTGAGARRAAARMTKAGAACVLGLTQHNQLEAVVAVIPERAGAADMVVSAAAAAGVSLFQAIPAPPAGDSAASAAMGPPAADPAAATGATGQVVPGGRRLVASIRGLQADGATVLLVSRQRRALAAADVGVGLVSSTGRPAWGAGLLAGDSMPAVALLMHAVRVAHGVSHRSVQLSEAGTALGAAVALGGAGPAAARSLLAVNSAGAIALASGAWSVSELAGRPTTAPEQRSPWHAMPADLVLDRLHSRAGGLHGHEAHDRWQPDTRQPPEPSLARAFVAELANPLTPILGGGAVLSASIGEVADAIIVSAVCGLSALMSSVQRVYTERSMARLLQVSAVTARVLRDGAECSLPASGLVTGDVVLVGAGDVVPADCRLLETEALQVDESSLTGESVPVDKTAQPVIAAAIADRRSMLYEGTTVAAGRATAVVVATGSATEAGRSMAALSAAAPVTGVEARLTQITRTTLPLALGSAGAVVAAGWLRGHPARDTIGAAVGLAVASVPEGLPFLVTAAQLASARRLARHGTLVRNPRTIEALGRVDVLCFDKTGTLTQGRMAVAAVSDGAAVKRLDAVTDAHRRVLAAALRASPPARAGRKAEHLTDQAVADGAAAAGARREDGYRGWRQLNALPFEPSRAYHATLASTGAGLLLSVKGAPEVVLPQCTRWRDRSIKPRDRHRFSTQLDKLTDQGYRVLAIAENYVAKGYRLDELTGLSLAGFVAFGDPVRATAGVSVRELRDAGVHVIMITGDHPATARVIATELDVLNGGAIISGTELDRLDDAALARALAGATVIARCTPEHKSRVVRALQSLGRVVAMTGDGANDAAAIRMADIGIALGRRGTPAARAAADLVVGDDRLETIISAVVEGRAMWRSVRQAIGILVGGNVGEIGYTLFGALLTGRSPLSARQLLLVNLLTDLVPALTVALRTPPPETVGRLLAEGPDTSLGSALTEEIAIRAAATGAAASGAWLAARMTGTGARARTVGLAAVVGAELGQTMLVGGRSPAVAAACVISLGVLVAVVQTPGVSQFFGCRPIGPGGWAIAGISALAATLGSAWLPPLGRAVTPAIRSMANADGPQPPADPPAPAEDSVAWPASQDIGPGSSRQESVTASGQ